DDAAVRLGLDAHDVERQLTRDAKPAPLSRRVVMDSLVLADDSPRRVHDLAARGPLALAPFRIEVALDEARVVAVGHEANLLRLALIGNVQSVPTRSLARLVLPYLAQWKERTRKLTLRQLPQEIGLILARVAPAQELVTIRRFVEPYARVVARRDLLTADAQGRAVERGELQTAVARDAGDRRLALQVATHER